MKTVSSTKGPKFPNKKITLFYVLTILIFSAIFAAGAELILRQKGIKPWHKPDLRVKVEPGGTLNAPHPTLGYSHIPGSFIVILPTGYSFKLTHLPNTLRITRPLDSYSEPQPKKQIWIFGCSFTHGWSLNDEETYPWLLQRSLREYEVVNFGVSGYGTIHSLLQFRDALETEAPKVAILAYAGFHDERNTFLRRRRKGIAPWNKLGPLLQPYARLDRDGKLRYAMADVLYREFPLMKNLALAHYIELKYNELEEQLYQSHSVSKALVLEMLALATKHKVKFVVANISEGEAMLSFAQANSISTIDLSVDLSIPGHRNFPHDHHPSAIANQKYADKLEKFLRAEVLE